MVVRGAWDCRAAAGGMASSIRWACGLIALWTLCMARCHAAEELVYRGLQCGAIPIPHFVETSQNCTFWRQGTANWNTLRADALEDGAPPCSDIDVSGEFDNESWAAKNCTIQRLSVAQAHQCLKGKRIVVAGDSMLRQWYHRLITFLRGQPWMADHLHHDTAVYSINGTHDYYRMQRVSARHHDDSVPDYLNGDVKPTASDVVLEFIWAPEKFPAARVAQVQPYAVVTGPMYHITHLAADFQDQAAAALLAAQTPIKLFWATTPSHQQPAAQAYERRNLHARGFLHGLRHVLPDAHILPFDRLAAAAPWKRRDQYHYGCYFDMFSGSPPVPKDGADCRDMFNLNAVQVFLHQLCASHK